MGAGIGLFRGQSPHWSWSILDQCTVCKRRWF